MKISEEAVNMIKGFEGFRPHSYQDSTGIWTIGYGTTSASGVGINPKSGMAITEPQADQYLRLALDKFSRQIDPLIKKPLTSNQYGAVMSLAYNIGPTHFADSTVLRCINKGDYRGAGKAFSMWNKSGGEILKGLVARRAKETEFFFLINQ